jgi:hypothetical protein
MEVGQESCGRHAVAFGGAEEKESNALVLERDGPNNQHNFVSRARKKIIILLINFMGSTKHTLCGIALFKLNTFLVKFMQVPSIDSMCFLHT